MCEISISLIGRLYFTNWVGSPNSTWVLCSLSDPLGSFLEDAVLTLKMDRVFDKVTFFS